MSKSPLDERASGYTYATGATLLIAGNGPTILKPGFARTILNGGAFIDERGFRFGVVSTAAVTGLDPTRDFIGLFGFRAGQVASALAGASFAGEMRRSCWLMGSISRSGASPT